MPGRPLPAALTVVGPALYRLMRMVPAGRLMLHPPPPLLPAPLGPPPRNFSQMFQALVDEYGGKGIWTWNPGRVTPSGAEVLDGVRMFGQCASLARALRAWAVAPPPYGLGLAERHVEVVRYDGQFGAGFVSRHVGTYYGLQPNVLSPGTVAAPRLENLYYWANHYVVKYQGRYFDPSYSKQDDYMEYSDLSEMAKYEIRPVTMQVDHAGSTWERAQDYAGRTVYFRMHDNLVVGGRRLPVEGPFARLP